MKTELENGTKGFGVGIVRLIRAFPKTVAGIEVGRQVLRSGTSIGANYREANRAESKLDFIHKVGIAEKEALETAYFLEICAAATLGVSNGAVALLTETNELLAIVTTIGSKAKGRSRSIAAVVSPSAVALVMLIPLSHLPLFVFH